MLNTDHHRLLVKVARLYYEQELTQSEISTRLRLSRQKVQRLLKEARQTGVVLISIRPLTGIFDKIERDLERRYGLSEAVVAETSAYEDHDTVTREIGVAAAEYLRRVVQPGDAITISWGSSLLGMVNPLDTLATKTDLDGVTVIQGLGGLGDPNNEIHAADLTRRLARILGGQAILLPAPGVAGSTAAGQALLSDPHVQAALASGRAANLAFMGIGAPPAGLPAHPPGIHRCLGRIASPAIKRRGRGYQPALLWRGWPIDRLGPKSAGDRPEPGFYSRH